MLPQMSPNNRPASVALPPPDAQAAAHSRRLQAQIRSEIARAGQTVPFDRFMELALYAPGLGYYVAGAPKLGAQGDFVTAPELSPLFAQCLAVQCGEVLAGLGGGQILEFGAGSGVLAADLLQELERRARLPERYRILELSPELMGRQHETLAAKVPHLLGRVRWQAQLPEPFDGLVLANEVLDAMPVSRFHIGASGQVEEIFVVADDAGFDEVACPGRSRGLRAAVEALQASGLAQAPGYTSELNLRLGPWLRALARVLRRGVALLIDYGYPRVEYYHAERHAGTLMCHYRHRAHANPYINLGLQDITAHVDFSAAAEQGVAAGFALAGFTTQAHFLIGCDFDALLARAGSAGSEPYLDAVLGAKQLLLPSEMGERFKVLGLQRGFGVRDLRERL